jgi:hypothetical protein
MNLVPGNIQDYWDYAQTQARRLRDRGYDGSPASQLNYLAEWSSSVKRRIYQQYHPYWDNGEGGNYTCSGGVPCTLEQSFDIPPYPQWGYFLALGVAHPIIFGHPEWANGKELNMPYEVANPGMDYKIDWYDLIDLGYYWAKSVDGKFLILTYCQEYYLWNGEVLDGCDMTAHRP